MLATLLPFHSRLFSVLASYAQELQISPNHTMTGLFTVKPMIRSTG
jgi:hypothetical protein